MVKSAVDNFSCTLVCFVRVPIDEGWKENEFTSVDTSLIACEDVYLPACCAMSADIVLMSPPPPSTRVTTDSVT